MNTFGSISKKVLKLSVPVNYQHIYHTTPTKSRILLENNLLVLSSLFVNPPSNTELYSSIFCNWYRTNNVHYSFFLPISYDFSGNLYVYFIEMLESLGISITEIPGTELIIPSQIVYFIIPDTLTYLPTVVQNIPQQPNTASYTLIPTTESFIYVKTDTTYNVTSSSLTVTIQNAPVKTDYQGLALAINPSGTYIYIPCLLTNTKEITFYNTSINHPTLLADLTYNHITIPPQTIYFNIFTGITLP